MIEMSRVNMDIFTKRNKNSSFQALQLAQKAPITVIKIGSFSNSVIFVSGDERI